MLVKLKKFSPILIFILLFILFFCYCQFLLTISSDEIWEYGYSFNIANGLCPYRDFNMVVTPLYPYLSSIFIKIFGPYLLSLNIFNALLLTTTVFISYKLIGKYALILVGFLLFYPSPTYNNLVLLLFSLFLYVNEKEMNDNRKVILTAVILSGIFLTKQSVGGVLFLVAFFVTKKKGKFLICFSIPIALLSIYLLLNNALYDFINYSFLGLFDFGTKNGNINIFMYITLIACAMLLLLYRRNKKMYIIYALAYQIMAFPIFDSYHMHIALIAFLLVLFMIYPNKIPNFMVYSCSIFFLIVSLFLNRGDDYIVKEKNFMYGRCANDGYFMIINETSKIIDTYGKTYDKIYNLTRYSYLTKLYRNDKIDKFDMTLNGNMGYKGYLDYIADIDSYCTSNKCLIIISPGIENNYMQKNYEINQYVMDNYSFMVNSFLGYHVYTN